jgi:transcriptional regulator with XRE-family HTH domain
MAKPLPNLLVSFRKRAALSQEEMAFLLGTRGGSKISRYERFTRGPSLEIVLAYEVIFGKSASRLFAGICKEIERRVVERARVLAHKTRRQKPSPENKRKLEILEIIIQKYSPNSHDT